VVVRPAHWSSQRVGDTLILAPPSGGAGGVIRYDERVRPIASVIDLIKAAPPPPGFEPLHADPIQEVVTHEGEFGVLAFIEGRINGAPAALALGFVLLDDYYARVYGIATDAELLVRLRAIVADLVVHDTHVLGRLRRRRVRYDPPSGWTPQQGLFEARWRPAAADDIRSIVVGPALPKQHGLAEAILAEALAGANPVDVVRAPYVPLETAHGLYGKRWLLHANGIDNDIVILEDDSFVYCARLDTSAGEPAKPDVLGPLVDSIQRIPKPSNAEPSTLFAYWGD
jgi:hypothetical protein